MEKKTKPKKISKAMEAVMNSFISMLGDAFPDIEPEDPICKQLKELVADMNINPQFRDLAINGIVNLCEEDPAAMKADMEKVRDKLAEILEDPVLQSLEAVMRGEEVKEEEGPKTKIVGWEEAQSEALKREDDKDENL